ncbi:FtsX-like permease family protein [Streptomyces sp. WMMB303]|uniref:FtsX-like permease family protein n=1 Tax=Streptomyces sp. WMMB303 TaxID=3034154 RepID=UPI0023ECD47E|nr:FtsX-like permease family protein [Streptomyces sp. WMMB303]MDF4251365.1 ABC transporter permease [Streptomyces sp. WMMB303]
MGRLLLIWRLVARDLRHRPGQAVMFLLAITAATASLTLGMTTDEAVSRGYMKTREATAGPDITAITTAPDPSALAERIADAPGVEELADPVPGFSTTIHAHGRTEHAAVEGRERTASAVDRPLVTSGTWVRSGGAVIERGFAQALGLQVGDRVTIGGRRYPVIGTAISAATAVYPWGNWAQGPEPSQGGGRIWLTAADARTAADGESVLYLLNIKLSDPDATRGWAETVFTDDLRGQDWVNTHPWQTFLDGDTRLLRFAQPTLVVGGGLLTAASLVTLASLAAMRAPRDQRRAGLFKAVGATPRTVAAMLLAQYLFLTVVAAAFGVAAGCLTAPALADPSAGLLNTAGPPTTGVVAAATVLALLVTLLGTLGPVLRTVRSSTVDTLADPAHPAAYRPGLTALTACLPTPLLIGVRLLARRPGRAVLSAVGTAATTVMVTAVLTFQVSIEADTARGASTVQEIRNAVTDQVMLGVTVALVALSALNTVFVSWSAAVQARRALAVTRTLGATPGQVVAALCFAQLLPAVGAIVVGMLFGIGLFALFSTVVVAPPVSWLATAAPAVLLAVATLTALPAWLHTRTPAGRMLDAGSA